MTEENITSFEAHPPAPGYLPGHGADAHAEPKKADEASPRGAHRLSPQPQYDSFMRIIRR